MAPFVIRCLNVRELMSSHAQTRLAFYSASLVVENVQQTTNGIAIYCRPRAHLAICHGCGHVSTRLHSHYERRLADFPWQGRLVGIQLRVRRLRCVNRQCRRQIFAETVEDVVVPYDRRTRRLSGIQRWVGLGLKGEAGARLIDRLGMRASADTLLRIVRRQSSGLCSTPRILGVVQGTALRDNFGRPGNP